MEARYRHLRVSRPVTAALLAGPVKQLMRGTRLDIRLQTPVA
jgi:hypothetical protein